MALGGRLDRWATDTAKIETVDHWSVPDHPESSRGLHRVGVLRVAPHILETAELTARVSSEVVVTTNEDVPGGRFTRSLTEPNHEVAVVPL